MSQQDMSSRILWPLLWLVGFRIRHDDNLAEVKIPRWVPPGQRQQITDAILEKVKWQKFDTRIL